MGDNVLAVKTEKASRQEEIARLRDEIANREKRLAPVVTPAASPAPETTSPLAETPVRAMLVRANVNEADLNVEERELMIKLREVRSRLAMNHDSPAKSEMRAAPFELAAPAARCSGKPAKGSSKGQSSEKSDVPVGQGLVADAECSPGANAGKRGGKMLKHQNLEDMNAKTILARLRRVCEVKESGKCKVSSDVNKLWESYDGEKRMELARILAASDWDESTFDSRVSKTYLRKKEKTKKVLKGWFTPWQMQTELHYTEEYIDAVKSYCKKNKLRQKTKYCQKSWEYWVEHQERQEVLDTEAQEERMTDETRGRTDGLTNFELPDLEDDPKTATTTTATTGDDNDSDDSESESTKDGKNKQRRGKNKRKKTNKKKNKKGNEADTAPVGAEESLEELPYRYAYWPSKVLLNASKALWPPLKSSSRLPYAFKGYYKSFKGPCNH